MKAPKLFVISFLLCTSVFVTVPSTAQAQESTASPDETSMTLQTFPLLDDKGHETPGRMLLVATLTTVDGQPVSEQQISFFEQIDFMGGARNADLGTALTDATGTAVIAYQPSTLEEHTVWAGSDDSADYAAARSPLMDVRVDELSPTFESEGIPLEFVRNWLPWAVGIIVLATWVVVLGALARAALGIRAAKPEEQPA